MLKPITLFFLLLLGLGGPLKAQEKSLYESEALMWVLDEIYAASYDLPAIYLIQEKLDPLHAQIPHSGCDEVKAKVVKNHFEEIFESYRSFYPDSSLPFDRAQRDIEAILGQGHFLRCHEQSENKWELIYVDHYRKIEGRLWIRFEVGQRRP